jgi:1,2-diacylglycerol 3-beta-glucosyltransferase
MVGQLDVVLSALQSCALIALLIVEAGLAVISLYLLVLAAASLFARRKRCEELTRHHRFAIMIPAHNEELLLGSLIHSLKRVAYPVELYDIHVVADNCSDTTADVARGLAANVHERFDLARPGKGHALNWLAGRLLAHSDAKGQYDAFVVLDADSVVSPNFLAEMNFELCAGSQLVQGLNDISNPVESWTTSLRYIAFCLICYLRPLGRSALGLSAGLRGNGMCLTRAVVERFRWDPSSPAEDHEFHMRLLQAGLTVAFAPAAHVYSQMPSSLHAARSQNIRWERGKIEVMSRYSPRLLAQGIRTGNWSMIDGALEPLVPPFSLAFGLAFGLLGASLLLGWLPAIGLGLFIVGAQVLYTLRGLAIMPVRSARLYLALAYAPWFIAWKTGVYVAVAFGAGKGQWVRTARSAD